MFNTGFYGWLLMVEIPQCWLLDYSWFYCIFWVDEFPSIWLDFS